MCSFWNTLLLKKYRFLWIVLGRFGRIVDQAGPSGKVKSYLHNHRWYGQVSTAFLITKTSPEDITMRDHTAGVMERTDGCEEGRVDHRDAAASKELGRIKMRKKQD